MKRLLMLALLLPSMAWAQCKVSVPSTVLMGPMTGTQAYGFGNYQVSCTEPTPVQLELSSAGPGGTHELRGERTGSKLALHSWTVSTRQTVGASRYGDGIGMTADTTPAPLGVEFAVQENKRPVVDTYTTSIDVQIIY